jgi:hypothetical protein
MNAPAASDVIIREPVPKEAARIAHFFRGVSLPPGAQFLAAVRTRPIERFVAAVACWPEGNIVRFRLACQPGVTRSSAAGPLINRVEASARAVKADALHFAESLADDSEWCPLLLEHGFERLHSERLFQVPSLEAWTRVMEIFQKYQSRIPAGWRTESIRHHPPELALDVIGEHRLMPPQELRDCWRPDSPTAFELDLSSFLFDGRHCMGALLTRWVQDALCVDVRVVRLENSRLRALGNACLLHHMASRCDPIKGPVHWLRFRAGEIEHRETANLAFRMKGRELPPRHVFGKKFQACPPL